MPVKITVNTGGSLRIEGDFELFDSQGNRIDTGEQTVIKLCRCGASAKQPFCDGSHKRTEFESPAPAK